VQVSIFLISDSINNLSKVDLFKRRKF